MKPAPPQLDAGARLRVFWPDEDKWFKGTVKAFNASDGKHKGAANSGPKRARFKGATRAAPAPPNRMSTSAPKLLIVAPRLPPPPCAVKYDDGDVEWLHLPSERYELLPASSAANAQPPKDASRGKQQKQASKAASPMEEELEDEGVQLPDR